MNKSPYFHPSRGVTLLELIIAIVIMGILAISGSEMLSKSFSITKNSDEENRAYSESRYALDRLANEIREINYPTVTTGPCTANQYCIYAPVSFTAPTTPYVLAPSKNFSFYKGVSNQDVNISMVGNTLNINSYPLLSNVSSVNFTFYDASLSNSAPTKINLKYVVIVINMAPPNSPSFTLRTRVALRNSG